MTHDDELGMAWWNALSERQRAKWSAIAGNTGRVKDAWEAFKRGSVDQTPPVDPTRRRFLSNAAGLAAGGTALALASPPASAADDPIFAAIDAFRRSDSSCVAVHGDIPDELMDLRHEAYSVVLRTRPSTPAGLAALTTWAREQADWLRANASVLHGKDLCALTVSIDDATRGMSGLEPWSPPLQAAAAVSADPAFAMIAEKQAADVAHEKACDALSDAEERYGFHSDAVEEACEHSGAACHAADEVGWKLARTVPTTLAGVAAVLRFANETEDAGNEWPNTDTVGPDGWHYQLRATMAAAIEALIKAQAGKAVQA
jgi:hypothetical protein